MKKQLYWVSIFIFVAAAAVAAFLLYRNLDVERVSGHGLSAGDTIIANSQTISGDGYVFGVPAGWRTEQGGRDSITAYSDGLSSVSSSSVTCKVEMSIFSYQSDVNETDWISSHIGADPSLAVTEQSSESVQINGGSGVKWNGSIDGAPTTMIYAFTGDHAYEIAPSVVGTAGTGNVQCGNMLDTFLSHLTIQ